MQPTSVNLAIMMRLNLRFDTKRKEEKSAYGIRLLHSYQAAGSKDPSTVTEALARLNYEALWVRRRQFSAVVVYHYHGKASSPMWSTRIQTVKSIAVQNVVLILL